MTFEEILDQTIEMLQRRGRLTYRMLKRQFELDDDFLNDLKHELITGQRVAADEGGEVLVWTGGSKPEPPPATVPATEPDTKQDRAPEIPAPGQSSARAISFNQAERRQMTVMFCDLVGSTPLSEKLDPEDLREVLQAYQEVCTKVIKRFEGHVARYFGDGLLVYFGYPISHEDDAQRAVHSGLGLVGAMAWLNHRLQQDKGIRLEVRVSIHTGVVVAGDMDESEQLEAMAIVGDTPNIAARLQNLAQPDTLVISEATYRLIKGFFDCQSLGAFARGDLSARTGLSGSS